MKDIRYMLANKFEIPLLFKSFKIGKIESPTNNENKVLRLSYMLENLLHFPKKLIPTIIYVNKIGTNPLKCLTILGKEYFITSVFMLNSD